MKHSNFVQCGKFIWVIFRTHLSGCLQTHFLGFASREASLQCSSKPGLALSSATGSVLLSLPDTSWPLLHCVGYVGGISRAAVQWLNKHSCLFQERPGTCLRSPWIFLIVAAVCCSDLSAPLVPSCWFVGKKPGCCGLLYVVFWILLLRAVWTLGGTLLCFGSHPECRSSNHMACGLLLFNHKWNKARKPRCDVEHEHPASLDVWLSQLKPVSAEHKGFVILAVAWLGAMNTNDPKSSVLAYVRIVFYVFMPVNFADSRFPTGAWNPGNYMKSYCKCT